MRTVVPAILILAAAACGGSSKKPAAPVEPVTEAPAAPPVEKVVEPEPPPPPPPAHWMATAPMTPIKGAKVKAFTVAFEQTEGEAMSAKADGITGLKAGAYHFVVHAGEACGKNAKEAGGIWAEAGPALPLVVVRGTAPALALDATELTLDGERAITGHTLVLHADKRGQPGAVLACGSIIATSGDADSAGDDDGGDE
ncbi:MAG: superoxide dismutase family protein [Kofleriaceae bacterium]